MKKTLCVATYNICHGLNFEIDMDKKLRQIDLDKVSNVINDLNVDIIGLNEVYDTGLGLKDKQTTKLSEKTNLKNHYFAFATCLSKIDGYPSNYGNANIVELFFWNGTAHRF